MNGPISQEAPQQMTIEGVRKKQRPIRIHLSLHNPFAARGTWLKGNLHCHLEKWKEQVEDVLLPLGYDFCAGMDHDAIVDVPASDLLVVPGAELSPQDMVVLGLTELPPQSWTPEDKVAFAREKGAIVFVPHPANGGWTYQQLESLCQAGLHGMELVNAAWWRKGDRGHADQIWHFLLNQGYYLRAFVDDDAHGPSRYRADAPPQARQGWTQVLVQEQSPAGILAAIHMGRTYGTEGPLIYDIRLEEPGYLVVECSPCRICHFLSGRSGAASAYPPAGDELGEHFVFDFTRSGYRAGRYLCVILEDEYGNRAFTSPLLLDMWIEEQA